MPATTEARARIKCNSLPVLAARHALQMPGSSTLRDETLQAELASAKDWSWDKSRKSGIKTKNPSMKAGASRLLPRTSGEQSSPTPLVQIFERKMTFGDTEDLPWDWARQSLPGQVASRSLSIGANLFATDKARLSNVSKAIFCASITSPATRQPWGTKHQPILRRPVSSSS
jgi:hypothetical protein